MIPAKSQAEELSRRERKSLRKIGSHVPEWAERGAS